MIARKQSPHKRELLRRARSRRYVDEAGIAAGVAVPDEGNEKMNDAFLNEIEQDIKHRLQLENRYRLLHIGLGVIIAACGFLTAAASQSETKTTLISAPTSLLIFGLLSAICAIINQILAPGEVYTHHQNVRRALAYIRGEVKFRDMNVKDAQALRTLAITNTDLLWNRLHDVKTSNVES